MIFPNLRDSKDRAVSEPLITQGKRGVYDVAFDPKRKKVYWTDDNEEGVYSSPLENPSASVVEESSMGYPQVSYDL